MAPELRVALIGYGLGGRAFHAPLIAVTPGLRLTTIVTSNAERRAEAMRAFPSAHLADSAEWVWTNAGQHDLVVITTPNRYHVPCSFIQSSIGAGVAWLRDGGPPPVNPDDAITVLDLIEAARASSAEGRVMMRPEGKTT